MENLKQHIQKQQTNFLEKQRNYYQQQKKSTLKKYKKVVYEEDSDSEPEFEQEEQEESESEEVEKKCKIKKAAHKKRAPSGSNIFDYINKNAKKHKR